MVRAERPVIEGHLADAVLDVDVLASDVEQLLGPVVLHRVHSWHVGVGTLMGLCADALVDASGVPGEVVDDPEVLALVDHLGLNLAHSCV